MLQHLRKEAHIGTGTNILCHRLKIPEDTNCANIATYLHTRHREHGREQYQPECFVRGYFGILHYELGSMDAILNSSTAVVFHSGCLSVAL